VTLVATLRLVSGTASAQSGRSEAPPRTAWGTPNLGGIFDYSSITPMQRPEKFGDQEYLTEEQVATLEQASLDRDEARVSAPVQRSVAGDLAGANGHAWQWGLEFGNQVVADRRTSRIIDPPNGWYPERTDAAKADAARRRGFGAILPADEAPRVGRVGCAPMAFAGRPRPRFQTGRRP
jgi:hypothetical protein